MINNNKQYPKCGTEITNSQLMFNILSQFPICGICSFIGGYFSDPNNGGFINVLGNTVSDVNTYLSSVDITGTTLFKVCDGSAPNDPNSPVYNTISKHLPNLTDDRFLCGSTTWGSTIDGAGLSGNNNVKDHQHVFSLNVKYDTAIISTRHTHYIKIKSGGHNHSHSSHIMAEPGGELVCNPPDGSDIIQAYDLYWEDRGTGQINHTVKVTLGDISGGATVNLNHTHTAFSFGASVNVTDPVVISVDNRPSFLSCFFIQRIR